MTKLRIGALLRTRRERLALGTGAIIVAAALVAGGVILYRTSHQGKQVTAYFTDTIGVYPGSTVRVLGVPVGTVDAVQPQGTQVKVTLTVNSGVAVPADAKAVVVAASVVSDRYIQLTPAYTGGPQLTDNATIPASRTAVPVEVDQIYASLNRFAQALGPNALNKNGALSELVKTGAGNRFDLEQAETNVKELTAQLAGARAAEQQVREKLSGRVKSGDLATVAQVKAQIATAQAQLKISQAQVETTRAQLDNARWELSQTIIYAPGNGTMVNVMLRPGYFVAGMPFNEVMTFVDEEYQIFALFGQNELHEVTNGNEAEITLDTYPGRIIKAHVDSILWAQNQGQLDASGDLPKTTFVAPPGRFPVKLVVADKDKSVFLAAGARGSAAIYTEHLTLVHIIRKVLLRTASYLDYIIIKHSISLGH